MKKTALAIILGLIVNSYNTLAHAQSAEYVLSKTLTCRVTGTTYVLVKKTKVLTKANANKEQAKAKNSLPALKIKLTTAKKTGNKIKIAKAQTNLDTAKALVASIKSCLKGTITATPTPAPTPVPTIIVPFPLTKRGGTYTGTWNNQTFNTTGPMTVTLIITDQVGFTMSLDLDGNVFGGANPPAEDFKGTFTGTAPFVFTFDSPLFGPNTVITLDANGDLTLDAPTPTNQAITKFHLGLDFNDTTESATGNYTLKAGAMDVSGSVTLAKSP